MGLSVGEMGFAECSVHLGRASFRVSHVAEQFRNPALQEMGVGVFHSDSTPVVISSALTESGT